MSRGEFATHTCPDNAVDLTTVIKLTAGEAAERLRIVSNIGQGSWAAVYQAVFDNKRVALKVLQARHRRRDERHYKKECKKFTSEAELLAACHGQRNIVQLYAVLQFPSSHMCGFESGKAAPFPALAIVLELSEGGPLSDVVKNQMSSACAWAYTQLEALHWGLDIASGLRYLHTREPRIIHRDVKLDNVLLFKQANGRTIAKLADLGLSVSVEDIPEEPLFIRSPGGTNRSLFSQPSYSKGAHIAATSDLFRTSAPPAPVITAAAAPTAAAISAGGLAQPRPSFTLTPPQAWQYHSAAVAPEPAALPSPRFLRSSKSNASQGPWTGSRYESASRRDSTAGSAASSCYDSAFDGTQAHGRRVTTGGTLSGTNHATHSGNLYGMASGLSRQTSRLPNTILEAAQQHLTLQEEGIMDLCRTENGSPSAFAGSPTAITGPQTMFAASHLCRARTPTAVAEAFSPANHSSASAAVNAATARSLLTSTGASFHSAPVLGEGSPVLRSPMASYVMAGVPSKKPLLGAGDGMSGAGLSLQTSGPSQSLRNLNRASMDALVEDLVAPSARSATEALAISQRRRSLHVMRSVNRPQCRRASLQVEQAQGGASGTITPSNVSLQNLTGRVGSLLYMAPEVYTLKDYNESADVFSFGVVLYEIITGVVLLKQHMLVDGRDLESLQRKMARGWRPARPTSLGSPIWSLIEACWAGNSNQRPDIDTVCEELRLLIATQAEAAGGRTPACGCNIC